MYYISFPARTCLALHLLIVQRTPNYKLTLREAFNLVKLLLETTERPMRVTHARICQRQSQSRLMSRIFILRTTKHRCATKSWTMLSRQRLAAAAKRSDGCRGSVQNPPKRAVCRSDVHCSLQIQSGDYEGSL